jgi:hypothetical protein
MRRTALIGTLLALAGNVHAVDGVILIDQAKALAGNVTPGDAPGFPVTLSRGGSYRLSGNLTVADADTGGILITAPNVTLDLNGFSVLGPVHCIYNGAEVFCDFTGSGVGILSNVPGMNEYEGSAITNGVVRGFGNHGVSLGSGALIDRLRVIGNGGDGIRAYAAVAITHSLAVYNRLNGYYGNNLNVQFSHAATNGQHGINANVNTGYGNNVLSGNLDEDATSSPVQLGGNLCGVALCP